MGLPHFHPVKAAGLDSRQRFLKGIIHEADRSGDDHVLAPVRVRYGRNGRGPFSNGSKSTLSLRACCPMASQVTSSTGTPSFVRFRSVRNSNSPGTRTSSTPSTGGDDLM